MTAGIDNIPVFLTEFQTPYHKVLIFSHLIFGQVQTNRPTDGKWCIRTGGLHDIMYAVQVQKSHAFQGTALWCENEFVKKRGCIILFSQIHGPCLQQKKNTHFSMELQTSMASIFTPECHARECMRFLDLRRINNYTSRIQNATWNRPRAHLLTHNMQITWLKFYFSNI